jgi:DNA-directed RNA polymerase subunit E'/Rpb7
MFSRVTIEESILIPYQYCSSPEKYFMSYAKDNLEGRCRNEGYLSIGSMTLDCYSCGLLYADSVSFDVKFKANVCNPEIETITDCKIINNTKIGIRGIYQENDNPIVFFVSREHNPSKNFDDYFIGQTIKVKIIGTRFELNDLSISSISEII